MVGLAALDPDALPEYDRDLAQRLVDVGAHVGAMTPGQLAALQSLGYEHAQGYLLARPMPADQIDALVRSGFGELVSGLALVV